MKLRDRVLHLLKNPGEFTAIDVARKVSENSLVISALLNDLYDSGIIGRKKNTNGVYVYSKSIQNQKTERKVSDNVKLIFARFSKERILFKEELDQNSLAAIKNIEFFLEPIVVRFNNEKIAGWKLKKLPESEAQRIIAYKLSKRNSFKELQKQKIIASNKAEKQTSLDKINIKHQINTISSPNQEINDKIKAKSIKKEIKELKKETIIVPTKLSDHAIEKETKPITHGEETIKTELKEKTGTNMPVSEIHNGSNSFNLDQQIYQEKIQKIKKKTRKKTAVKEITPCEPEEFINDALCVDDLEGEFASWLSNHTDNPRDMYINGNSKIQDVVADFNMPFGKQSFFIRYKHTKRIDTSDLYEAFLAGKNKDLPVVFLTSAQLSKKAKQHWEKTMQSKMNIVSL